MYLALIVLVLVGITAGALVARIARAVLTAFRNGNQKEDSGRNEKGQPEKPSDKQLKESKDETQEEVKQESHTENMFSEEQTARLDSAQGSGISEDFWKEDTKAAIDSKKVADTCVQDSSLTYIEVNNKELAGSDFMGFNLIVEQDSRMALTYGGQTVATITRVEKVVKKEVDGKIEETKTVHFRTNTFPPKLTKGMIPEDVEKMLSAASAIRSAEGNPELVMEKMTSLFCSPENVERFKRNVAPKIQAKESRSRTQKRVENEHKQGLTKVNK